MKKRRQLFVSLLLVCVIPSCRANMYNLINNSPCSPPCWQDVTPGLTTAQEAEEALLENPALHNVRIGDISGFPSEYTIVADIDRKQGITVFIQDDIVEAIWISSLGGDLNIRLSKIINIFGEPDSIFINRYVGHSSMGYQFNLLYPDAGTLVSVKDYGQKGYIDLKGKDRVLDIIFMEKSEYMEFMIENVADYEWFTPDRTLPWEGYRQYDLAEVEIK